MVLLVSVWVLGGALAGLMVGLQAPTPPPPALSPRIGTNWDSYTRALLVIKDRRHLFVTPWRTERWKGSDGFTVSVTWGTWLEPWLV
jgi:hypothetical protein